MLVHESRGCPMRLSFFALTILVVSTSAADAQCKLVAHDINLTSQLLDHVGFSPSGKLFEFLAFDNLVVTFGEKRTVELPSGSGSATVVAELVPATIRLSATILSPRNFFLSEVSAQLPRPSKNDSIGVHGGFMRIESSERIRVSGNVRAVDNSSKVKWWRQGKASTPIWFDLIVKRQADARDIIVDGEIQAGATNVSGPLTQLVDIVLAPVSIGLKIFDEKTVGESIDTSIGKTIDERVSGELVQLREYTASLFRISSMNAFISDKALLFSDVFKRRLRYTGNTGFSGQNPRSAGLIFGIEIPAAADAQVKFLLDKASDPNIVETMITTKTACQLQSDLMLLRRLSGELRGEPSVSHIVGSNENLDQLSQEYFGTAALAMAIGQMNGMARYRALAKGEQIQIPRVETLANNKVHVVERGDSLWKIFKDNKRDWTTVRDFIDDNRLSTPDTLYPGMVLSLGD